VIHGTVHGAGATGGGATASEGTQRLIRVKVEHDGQS